MVPRLIPAVLCLALAACTPLGLNTASANLTSQATASPGVLDAFEGDPAVLTARDWTERRAPILRKAFEDHVYGPVPVELKATELSRRVVDANYQGEGVLEEIDVRIGEAADSPSFRIALALPKDAAAGHPAPLLVNENFCGNAGTMASAALSDGGCMNEGFEASLIRLIFGKYIIEGPNAEIMQRGYAYATLSAQPFAADDVAVANAQLEQLGRRLPEGRAPEGVIAVWAAAYGWALDVLEKDPRIDASRTAVWGHSRQGKAALLAAAFDPRIEAALVMQAGKGGSTLTRSHAGETVKQITRSYPHWFAPAYAGYSDNETASPIDQHQLIALVAPRPILLGNGWKDVWSDPNGSFRAAQGADPVYKLMGARGLTQSGMRDQKMKGEIDFYIREGGHGVRVVDWDYMLDWLDRWLGRGGDAVAAP
jgi:fermentation-respiration switch protein FrsA (DUF1100 family)